MRNGLLGGFTATLVAAPLIPTDAIPERGTAMGLIACWLVLLFAWCLAGLSSGQRSIRWGWTSTTLALFAGWHAFSGLMMADDGHARPTLNTVWLWVGMAAAFWLARQLLETRQECRALVAVMISLAICLSLFGYYQYFVSNPNLRRLYREDPNLVLQQAEVVAPAGSPQRRHFEDRLNSTEPIATFTLTNSLAAFLSPWLVAALGIAATSWRTQELRVRILVTGGVTALLIGGCWLLTKSRTSWVATSLGLLLLVVYGRRAGWRPDWRYLALGSLALGLLVALAAFVGGLDWLVIAESSKALQYRLQYWQSTAWLIQDFPWLGCGPGNFQQYYQTYKLPQASESVAMPHNFLLEIWATAGTPAVLAFAAVLCCFAAQWSHTGAGTGQSPLEEAVPAGGRVRTIYWGALAGVLLAFPLGAVVGYLPAQEILLVGLPCSAGLLCCWHAWVIKGRLPATVIACSIVVLLVNLLGADGISYPGVSLTLWVLMAIGINSAEESAAKKNLRLPAMLGVTGSVVVVASLFFQTYYFPVLECARWLNEGTLQLQQYRLSQADAAYRKAAEADPYWAEPWTRLASLRHTQWLALGGEALWDPFVEAADQVLVMDSHSSQAYSRRGDWMLAAYRRWGASRHVHEAVRAYRQAAELYPNGNLVRAQLAWTLRLAGEPRAAGEEAKKALHLDGLNPHSEQKLRANRVFDPGPSGSASGGSQQLPQPDTDAEQLMQALRSGR